MKGCGWLLGSLYLCCTSLCIGYNVISDTSGANRRFIYLVGEISPQEFAKLTLTTLADPQIRFGKLVAYRTQADRLLGGPQLMTDCSLSSVQSLIEANHLPNHDKCPDVQEAIKLGSNLISRSVDRNCKISLTVLSKKNPLEIYSSQGIVEVLDLNVSPSVEIESRRESRPAGSLSVRVRKLRSINDGESLVNQLKKIIRSSDFQVSIRTDAWFYRNCDFPALFGFRRDTDRTFPNVKQFEAAPFLDCLARRGGAVTCIGNLK